MILHPLPVANIIKVIQSFFKTGLYEDNWNLKGYQPPLWYCSSAEILSDICMQHKNIAGKVSIMLPSYFCGQSLRYLRNINVEFIFYELNDNLTPDYKNILNILKENSPDFFLHVHYFGQVLAQNKTRELCSSHNMLMIEDCAHVIHPSAKTEWLGDCLFFSPHKFFPVKECFLLKSHSRK